MNAVINTNIAAIRTHNVYNKNNSYMNEALTKVATGQKINSAKDGASTYAITEKMRERIRANDQANQNVQNDTALLKTAQGGIGNTIDILKTLKERAINAANDSNVNQDRGAIQTEINQLLAQIDENATKVKFNGRTLLNGTAGKDDTSASAATASVTTPDTTTTTYTQVSLTTSAAVSANAITSQLSTSPSNGDEVNLSSLNGIYADNAGAATYSGNVKLTYNDGSAAGSTQGWFASSAVDVYTASTTTTPGTTSSVGTASGSTTDNGTTLNFYVGGDSGFNMTFDLDAVNLSALNLSSGLDVTDSTKARAAISTIESALETALQAQTKAGAMEARLGYTSDNLTTMNENLEAATSTMRDADIAKEMTNYMKFAVLSQASQYMLAQSGQNAFSVLNLLQA